MTDELEAMAKYCITPGDDLIETLRREFPLHTREKRVTALRALDEWTAVDPRRHKSYARLHRVKRELEATHNRLMSVGR